jgi:NAD-dependent dihydropyrimidine dehydrogenase PreA subunit
MGKKVILCNCNANSPDSDGNIVQSIDFPLTVISDLCGLSVTAKDKALELFSANDEFLVIACYPRAVKLLLRNIGVDPKKGQFTFLNFKEMTKEALINKIQSFQLNSTGKSLTTLESDPEWPGWFPLIDDTRCTACGQCADFCLFGVYEKQAGKIKVVNPKSCKNNCPACARLCPQLAIIFPKYTGGGVIGGSEQINEIEEQKRQQMDMNSILGIDIYQALEQRKLKRQSIIKNEAIQKALEEREKALQEKTVK